MKSHFLLTVAVGAFAGGFALSAQLSGVAEDPLDATRAAPNNHRVLFENDHIRLLEVIVQPGETENVHVHNYSSVYAFDASQPKMDNRFVDGTGSSIGRNFNQAANAGLPAEVLALMTRINTELNQQDKTGWVNKTPVVFSTGPDPKIPGAHQLTNTDAFPHHFYRLEFKQIEGTAIMEKKRYK
jgi:hypothetical protein